MAKSRRQKTLTDYAVIAISPVLIMLVVGSLVFFLLEATYTGQWDGRLRWILFWFVFGSVLIARIAIDQSKEYASLYGLVLGGAVALVIFKYVDFVFGALCLLGVVWWCTNKLTWDCTLIDDSDDASGEGLLQAAGLDQKTGSADNEDVDSSAPESPPEPEEPPPPAWKSMAWPSIAITDSDKSDKPHAPGLWVLYFALAALPLFGLGQLLIPAEDVDRRRYALQLLFVYVAASLALLMTTSFLGLRRYLRQRRMQMPESIVGSWLGVGAGLIVLVLGVTILLPRPNAKYSATAMLDKLAGNDQQASWFDVIKGEGSEGEGERTGEPKDGETEQKQDGNEGDGAAKGKNGKKVKADGKKGGQQKENGAKGKEKGKDSRDGDRKDGKKRKKQDGNAPGGDAEGDDKKQSGDEQSGENQGGNKPSQSSSSAASSVMAWLAGIGKWIIYLLAAAGILWYVIRNRVRLLEALRQLWRQLMSLFGRTADKAQDDDAQQESDATPPRPFALFTNPFLTGAADRMEPGALIVYTFEALEAWAFEQDLQRPAEQTPIEFGDTLSRRFPDISPDVSHTCQLYARLAYSSTTPKRSATLRLECLWQSMSATAQLVTGGDAN
jgi:hypothetical protein